MERPIAYHLLLKDELEYEIAIRDQIPEGTVSALRSQLRKLVIELPADEIIEVDRDPLQELNTITHGLTELNNFFAQDKLSFKKFNRVRALAHHLYHRLGRVSVKTPELINKHAAVEEVLNRLLIRVDELFKSYHSSFKQANDPEQASPSEPPSTSEDIGISKQMKALTTLNHRYTGVTCVRVYLERLEELCVTRQISEVALFQGAVELFSDRALLWYRGVRNEMRDWPTLRSALIEEFSPIDYDQRLLREISLRTQGEAESSSAFISIMLNYYSRLSKQVPEDEKLQTIRYNLRPRLITALAMESIRSLQELKLKCRMLENSFTRAADFREPPRSHSNALAPDLTYHGKAPPKIESVRPSAPSSSFPSTSMFCLRCRVPDHKLSSCPSREVVCFSCGRKGVKAPACPDCRQKPSSKQNNSKNA